MHCDEDVKLLKELGWKAFVDTKRGIGNLGSLNFTHPTQPLLQTYKAHGAPAEMKQKPWSKNHLLQALCQGSHRSCYEYLDFLQGEFVDMTKKRQWVILPFSKVENLPGLRLSPPGCVPQQDRHPRWICDYTFSGVNAETLNLFAHESMQFGHALHRDLREILLHNPELRPVNLLKVDISDGFY